jgi:hypothetical protein
VTVSRAGRLSFLFCTLFSSAAVAQTIDLASARLPTWRFERAQAIGSIDGQWDSFVRPAVVTVADDGEIYVLDTGLQALRVFDDRGRFVRQYGGRGLGPGEYTAPAAFGFRDDTVWISDARTGVIAFYARDGDVLDSFPLRTGRPDQPPLVPVRVLGPDSFLVVAPPGPDLRRSGIGPVRFQQSVMWRPEPAPS